jgi:hypothetical protein
MQPLPAATGAARARFIAAHDTDACKKYRTAEWFASLEEAVLQVIMRLYCHWRCARLFYLFDIFCPFGRLQVGKHLPWECRDSQFQALLQVVAFLQPEADRFLPACR